MEIRIKSGGVVLIKKLISATRSLSLPVLTCLALLVVMFSPAKTKAQDQPVIQRDSVQVNAFTLSSYKKDFKVFSWVPRLNLRVNGPIASGSQIYAQFTAPGGVTWKFDCKTEETGAGHWWQVEDCGGRDALGEDKGATYTGPVNFTIKMRNELMGGDAALFSGEFKVARVHSNETGPDYVNHFVHYVDQDWNLPIGYMFLEPDDVYQWKKPTLSFAFWARTELNGPFEPHLFHGGKEVGKMMYEGEEVGKAGCEADIENNTTHYVEDTFPQKAKWARVRCSFPNVRGWDKTGEGPGMFGPLYLLSANPGEYEFKLLWNNHLARSMKFTVGPEGKLDNGIATANKLGSERIIVPVQIIGDQDGPWDKTAWKTEAFYGNPLTGFTPAP